MPDVRTCSTCKVSKPITDFHRKGPGKWVYNCKPCRREYNRKYYRENSGMIIASNKVWNDRRVSSVIAEIDRLKRGPCSDCGGRYNPWQMDFDHRDPSLKEDGISRLIRDRKWSLERVLEEVAKCDLVCANCHRQRTHVRQQYYSPSRVDSRSDAPNVGRSGSIPDEGAEVSHAAHSDIVSEDESHRQQD